MDSTIALDIHSTQEGTMAALRSRVEQQSTLIAMLKQRGDNTLSQLTESQTCSKMLSAQVEALQKRLSQEEINYKTLEQRFSILVKNHEEMIRIKDEYKQANLDLQAKYGAYISKECEKCVNLENKLVEANAALSKTERICGTLSKDSSRFHSEMSLLKEQLEAQSKIVEQQRIQLTIKVNASEEQVCRLESLCKSKEESNEQLQARIRCLETDKGNFTTEMMSMKALLAQCEQNLKHSLDREQTLQESFRLRSEEVSKDIKVKQLRQQLLETEGKLSAIENDYAAYKKHSSQLLAQERELNNKLRHILD